MFTVSLYHRFGYESYIIARPILYDLLHRQVPKERIHMGVKITETSQDDNGVRIHCNNGAVYEGDILVGADGAYSIVRQSIYSQLKAENRLPVSDALPLPYSTECLVGQTRVLDVSEFPRLAEEDCQFMNIIGDNKPYSVCSPLYIAVGIFSARVAAKQEIDG
jgi:flavin-dependent dehydrogenase